MTNNDFVYSNTCECVAIRYDCANSVYPVY